MQEQSKSELIFSGRIPGRTIRGLFQEEIQTSEIYLFEENVVYAISKLRYV